MISVIVPVYNVENYLHTCLNSILKQTYEDIEIICIDDASTDSSLEILEYFSKKDSRIKIIKNKINKGLGPSRNIGIDASKGKYILFLDSDDWYSLDAFESLVAEAEKNNLEVLMFKNIVYYEEQRKFGMEKYYDMEFLEKFSNVVFNHWDLDKSRFFSVPIGACNKLYLKSFLDENNIRFPSEDYIHEDNPFYCKVMIKAERISFLNKYLYNRRRRNGSIMTFTNERLFDNINIVDLVARVFLENLDYYEYYKKEVLNYVFNTNLNTKYDIIDDEFKEEFFKEIQNVYKKFIIKYGLYNDIKKNVNEDILKRFKFEEIINDIFMEI